MKKSIADKFKKVLKRHYLIIILVVLFFIIKLVYLSKAHNVIWDEAVYLGIGKYIYSFGKLGFWEIIRPIGFPLVLGLIWKSGLNYVFFSEILAVMFAVGNILLTYLIGVTLVNRRVGFVSALILSMTSVFFLYTNYILTGIPSTFFILLGIYVYLKKKNIFLAGVFCGIGTIFRFPQLVILFVFGAMLFFSLFKRQKEFFKKGISFITGVFLVHLPYFIFNFIIYNKETSRIYHALFRPWILAFSHQSNPAESIVIGTIWLQLYNLFYYVIHLLIQNTLFVFLIPGIIFILRNKPLRKKGFNLLLWAFFLFLLYFTIISNKQVRFLLVLLPFASLLAGYGFYYSFLHSKKDRVRIFIVILVIISFAGVIPRNASYYEWRVTEELPIVSDYYKFFEGKDVKGPILTTDPVPVVYVDAKFIPFYFSVDLAYKLYIQNREDAYAIIFSPESFYCAEGDPDCRSDLKNLVKHIETDNDEIFSEIYRDRAYYIYLNKDFK